jgi:hypothetical protein
MVREVLVGIFASSVIGLPLAMLAVSQEWSPLAFYGVFTLGILVGLFAMFRFENARERERSGR